MLQYIAGGHVHSVCPHYGRTPLVTPVADESGERRWYGTSLRITISPSGKILFKPVLILQKLQSVNSQPVSFTHTKFPSFSSSIALLSNSNSHSNPSGVSTGRTSSKFRSHNLAVTHCNAEPSSPSSFISNVQYRQL
jgi:hypothetical protein